jgi:hypothetical protein
MSTTREPPFPRPNPNFAEARCARQMCDPRLSSASAFLTRPASDPARILRMTFVR